MAIPNRPEAGNMQMTNEQITELAEPFWLKDAQKEGEFFDANGFARALLSASKPAAPEGWKLTMVERSYDMRAKAIIAFNTAEQSGKDRDDALDAAWQAMLAASPAAPVQSAEPVAWRIDPGAGSACDRFQSVEPYGWQYAEVSARGGSITPLYTTPQPSPTAVVLDDELLLAAKEVLANGHQHDVGGGDVFLGTCESAERLERAVRAFDLSPEFVSKASKDADAPVVMGNVLDDERAAGIREVVAYLNKKADDYALEYGSDDMGALSFGTGKHAADRHEYHSNLLELAEEVEALAVRAVSPQPVEQTAQSEAIVDDLRLFVSRLARSLRLAKPDNALAEEALDYLRRKGLFGSPLRAVAQPVEQTRALIVEECARFVERGSFLHPEAPPAKFAKECAVAMRSQLLTAARPASGETE
jgi:hypothetical protein